MNHKVYPKFKARINFEGISPTIIPFRVDDYRDYLRTLMNQDVEVVIRPHQVKQTRSSEQNKYYWGVVLPILSDYTGHSDAEAHEILKHVFLGHFVEFKTKIKKPTECAYRSHRPV